MTSIRRMAPRVLLAAILTPLAGYLGLLAMPWMIVYWLMFFLFGWTGTGTLGVSLEWALIPLAYGLKLAWPVSATLAMVGVVSGRPNILTPFVFAAIGALCGALTIITATKIGIALVDPKIGDFSAAGTVAGLMMGFIFGFVIWRADVLSQRPQESKVGYS